MIFQVAVVLSECDMLYVVHDMYIYVYIYIYVGRLLFFVF